MSESLDQSSTCRILTVSPNLDQALSLIDRIKVLSNSIDHHSTQIHKVPWTIVNKYYSANVHFSVHPIHGLAPYQFQDVPAILFVWANGQDYRPHIQRLANDLTGYDPEVMLAVRVNLDPPFLPDQDQDDDIDEFLSSHGFEFVDAIDQESSPSIHPDEIPKLPRVIDALSTIMWPNMQPSTDPKGGLLDPTRDDSVSSLQSLVTQPTSDSGHQTRRKQEIAALKLWLEEDDAKDQHTDPWKFSTQRDTLIQSPTELEPSSTLQSSGFDDDFSAFVSAPPNEPETTPLHADSFSQQDEESLKATVPIQYHSLGSTSDLGDAHHPPTPPKDITLGDEDSDDGLPTKDEILTASSRLFGSDFIPPSTRSKEDPPAKSIFDDSFVDGEFDFGNSDYEVAPFDISHVMSALQVMKAEISHMEDEGERRKAAASVALSLVYGLEGQPT